MCIINIKTPIWTGDIDSKSNSLHLTGIMGSLRWWAEAILRGLDKFVCDPVEDKLRSPVRRCPIKRDNQENQYCPACLIFGATGMRRMFKLHMNGGAKIFSNGPINIKPDGRRRGWYLGSGLKGKINLDIVPLDKNFEENLVLAPLTIAANWGGFGAKIQHGYGVVELENYLEMSFENFKRALEARLEKERLKTLNIEERSGSNNSLPNIKEMFFAKVQFETQGDDWWKEVDGIKEKGRRRDRNYYEGYSNDSRMVNWVNSGSVPTAPAIKNWLRYKGGRELWATRTQNDDRRIENWLFGSTRNGKSASKINLSCAYHINNNLWEFRIWGWIPENKLPKGFDRDDFLNKLKDSLDGSSSLNVSWNSLLGSKTKGLELRVWREFDSSRDTVKQNESVIGSYIQSLLKGGSM